MANHIYQLECLRIAPKDGKNIILSHVSYSEVSYDYDKIHTMARREMERRYWEMVQSKDYADCLIIQDVLNDEDSLLIRVWQPSTRTDVEIVKFQIANLNII